MEKGRTEVAAVLGLARDDTAVQTTAPAVDVEHPRPATCARCGRPKITAVLQPSGERITGKTVRVRRFTASLPPAADEGWLYLVRRAGRATPPIVGWTADARLTRTGVLMVRDRAVARHRPRPGCSTPATSPAVTGRRACVERGAAGTLASRLGTAP